jgi:hypothetical protein
MEERLSPGLKTTSSMKPPVQFTALAGRRSVTTFEYAASETDSIRRSSKGRYICDIVPVGMIVTTLAVSDSNFGLRSNPVNHENQIDSSDISVVDEPPRITVVFENTSSEYADRKPTVTLLTFGSVPSIALPVIFSGLLNRLSTESIRVSPIHNPVTLLNLVWRRVVRLLPSRWM